MLLAWAKGVYWTANTMPIFHIYWIKVLHECSGYLSLLVRIPYNFLLFDYTHSMRHWKASTCAKMLYSEYMNQYWLVTTNWKIVHAFFHPLILNAHTTHLRSFRIRYRINMFIILRTFETQHQKLICLNDFSSMSFHCDSFVYACSLRAIDLKPWKIE